MSEFGVGDAFASTGRVLPRARFVRLACLPRCFPALCLFLLTIWIGPGARTAAAADPSVVFDAAARSYVQGRPAEAAAIYESIITNGVATPAVLFNQGNAWLQAGEIGRAIASYRRARQLAPRDTDITAALTQARTRVGGGSGGAASVTDSGRWLAFLAPNEWALLGLGGIWLWFGVLFLRRFVPRLRDATANLVWVGAALALVGGTAGAVGGWQERRPEAVVLPNEVTVRFGPLEESQSAFTLPGGAEVRITDRKNDWLQVRDAAGRAGWVPSRQLATFP